MISGSAMGKRVKVIMSVLLLVLLSCVTTEHLVGVTVGSTQTSGTTLSMRPLLRDAGEGGNVISHKRFLLTTRYAPIGFPPPPEMTSPSPPGY